MDVPAYIGELNRCAESLDHREQIPALRKSLSDAWVVTTRQGKIEVSTEWLRDELWQVERDPKDTSSLSKIKLRIAALRRDAEEFQSSPERGGDEAARQRLETILTKREFAGAQGPSATQLLISRIERWIAEKIVALLSRLHLGGRPGTVLTWIVLGFALAALLYWLWRALFSGKADSVETAAAPEAANDARQWAKDALAAAELGDYREAVHCAYWAAIVHLENLNVLKRDRARTPRESLRLLDAHPREQKLLREFTGHFELIWYGYRQASVDDWSDARTNLEKMGCLAPSTAATANS